MRFEIELAGQPITKKNSIRAFGRRVLPSKAYCKYADFCRLQMSGLGKLPHFAGDIELTAHYWLQNRRTPDLLGLLQATSDILQDEYKNIDGKRTLIQPWLYADDNQIKSYDGSRILGVDKNNPRTIIIISSYEGFLWPGVYLPTHEQLSAVRTA